MPASGPVSEGQRLALLNRLCEVLGEEEARTLMESLPAVHWHDLATKDDLKTTNKAIEANKAAIEASEQRLRTEMHAGFANIRTETAADFKTLRAREQGTSGRDGASVRQADPHDGVHHAGVGGAGLGRDPGCGVDVAGPPARPETSRPDRPRPRLLTYEGATPSKANHS